MQQFDNFTSSLYKLICTTYEEQWQQIPGRLYALYRRWLQRTTEKC